MHPFMLEVAITHGGIVGSVTHCGSAEMDIEVYIRGTSYDAITDGAGDFCFMGVEPGTYDLVVKMDGTVLGTIPQVSVTSDQVTDSGVSEFCADIDADGDGYTQSTDCNDDNATVNPGASEVCGDGVDNDCNDVVDDGCQVCTDSDLDGFYAETGCGTYSDCDDTDPNIYPGAPEVCDGVDNDCDREIDELVCTSTFPTAQYRFVGLKR